MCHEKSALVFSVIASDPQDLRNSGQKLTHKCGKRIFKGVHSSSHVNNYKYKTQKRK